MGELRRIEFPQFTVREYGYAAGGRMERHAHDFSNVTAVICGDMEETTDTGEHRGRACSVLVKPGGTMHRNRWLGRGGTRTVSVEVADASPFARDLRARPWQWMEDPCAARAALDLLTAIRGSSRDAVERAAVALLAAGALRTSDAPPWLSEVKRILEERFDEPVRFDAIAADLGLHPVYLSRAFRRHTGLTMGDFVRSLRLRQVRHLLDATARPLTAISADSGFADASHLCRVFSETHGVTPKTFRRLTAFHTAAGSAPTFDT